MTQPHPTHKPPAARLARACLLASLAWMLTASAACDEEIAITPPPRDAATNATPSGSLPADTTPAAQGADVFISVTDARALHAQGATFLDARSDSDFSDDHIQGAHPAPWQRFVDGDLSGLLTSDLPKLQAALREAGVSNDKPVIVYGGWRDAWGEEGRLFWMLEYLGHSQTRILAGGFEGWEDAGGPVTDATTTGTAPGDFTAKPLEDRRATADEVLDATQQGNIVILDTRDPEEYDGATPYGSSRGGHIPRAQHFWWKDAFDANGALKSRAQLRALLGGYGIQDDSLVIAYCTGGVRSGFVYAVMRWAGYQGAQNYDGSWWEWSSRSELPVSEGGEPTSQP